MSKREQLIEFIISDIVAYIMEDTGLTMIEAMQRLYFSETFSKLNDEFTGLYLESPSYVYDIYKNEKANGRIIQEEM